jgi:hypothetical protein
LIAVCVALLSAETAVSAQGVRPALRPNQPVTLPLALGESREFNLHLKAFDFAEVTWLANDNIVLDFNIYDALGRRLETGDSNEHESALFVAPRDGDYRFVLRFDPSSELKSPQTTSLEYSTVFKLPSGSKLKDLRKTNGYDVKILTTPSSDDRFGNSVLLVQKGGQIRKVMKMGGDGRIAGFYFGDDVTKAYTIAEKRSIPLITKTLDKTGDGIPDVLINYYSGGAHCCSSSYFLNLGDAVQLVDSIDTGHDSIVVVGKNPKGGLLFSVSDTSYAYWQIGFAGSAFPNVILHFVDGKLLPDFARMTKPPPPLTVLRNRARNARNQLSNDAYLGEDEEGSVLYKENASFQTGFWGEMLDLIYSGNESLAWQYLDLVWPSAKRGKDIFLSDFKKKLSDSPYWRQIQENKNK